MEIAADLGDERRARIDQARLYLACDSRPGGRTLEDVLRAAIAGGAEVVQLRDKGLGDQQLTAAARAARELCEQLGALLIVNDRPAVAVAAGADGVHLGQQDMAVERARAIVGPEMLIGLSTHSAAEIEAARGVDYIGVGPVYETPTKPGRRAVGLELIEYASAHASVPFFAIGGIDALTIEQVLAAGARRVAVVRAIAAAADPFGAALELSRALQERDRPGRAVTGAAASPPGDR
jgi:thiamine-phosphate pyrophosphorylase